MKYFLSHSSHDERVSEQICLALRNLGHEVFFDRHSLPPGDEFDQRIRSEINACDRFIFCFSKHAIVEGSYTLTELKLVQERWSHPKQKVLTIVLDETPIDQMPPYLLAATFLRPVGAVSAEVGAFIAQGDAVEKRLKRTRFAAIAGVAATLVFAMAGIAYANLRTVETPYQQAQSRLEARLPARPGMKTAIYPQFGLGFVYPGSWQVEDGATPYGVPDIDVIQRYTDTKAAIGVEVRLMPVQPNYVNDIAAEVANQADVYRRFDPELVVGDFTLDGMPAKRFSYTQSTGDRRGAIERIWVRLAPEVKLQIISFTYTDEPDRADFEYEARRIVDSIVIDKQLVELARQSRFES